MKPEFLKSLYEVTRRLDAVKFSYMLVGSANLAFQGISIIPGDIDIAVLPEDFAKLEESFPEYELINSDDIGYGEKKIWKMNMQLDGVDIDFFTEEDGYYIPYLKRENTITKELEDIVVVCLTLEQEKNIYEATGRTEKSELVKAFLEN